MGEALWTPEDVLKESNPDRKNKKSWNKAVLKLVYITKEWKWPCNIDTEVNGHEPLREQNWYHTLVMYYST